MTNKEIDEIVEKLHKSKARHIFLISTPKGIALSSCADGDNIFDYLQCIIDINEDILEIMEAVVKSRREKPKTDNAPQYLN